MRGLEIRDRGTAEVQGTLNFDLHAVWMIIMYCEVQGTLNFTCRCTLRVDCVRWLCTLRVGGARCARCHARKVARRGWRRKGRSTSARKMWRTRSSGRRSQPLGEELGPLQQFAPLLQLILPKRGAGTRAVLLAGSPQSMGSLLSLFDFHTSSLDFHTKGVYRLLLDGLYILIE